MGVDMFYQVIKFAISAIEMELSRIKNANIHKDYVQALHHAKSTLERIKVYL
jgi:hypothetical protein